MERNGARIAPADTAEKLGLDDQDAIYLVDAAHIQLKVKDQQGREVLLIIERTTTHTEAVRRVLPPQRSACFGGSLHGGWGVHCA